MGQICFWHRESIVELFEEQHILDNVKENGAYLYEKLEQLAKEIATIKEHRGFGFMQGLEFTYPVKDIVKKALDHGLILISAGANTVRFLPPLVMDKEHIDEMLCIFRQCIEKQNNEMLYENLFLLMYCQ